MADAYPESDPGNPLSDRIPQAVLVLGDTRTQVFDALAAAGREPWMALNEHDLRELIRQALPNAWQRLSQGALHATGAPAWWSPSHRYGLAVHADHPTATEAGVGPASPVMTWHWVNAPSAAAAIELLDSQGVRGELKHLVDVQVVMHVIGQLAKMRTDRGVGAWTDARFLGSLDARRRVLAIERHGSVEAQQAVRDRRRSSLGHPAPRDPNDTTTVAA